MVVSKLQNSNQKNIHQRKKVAEIPKSCFAAIISANIKLVYLKRSLVQDLLTDPEAFEIKSDPNDYFQQNSHQLLQVTDTPYLNHVADFTTLAGGKGKVQRVRTQVWFAEQFVLECYYKLVKIIVSWEIDATQPKAP
ncbi:hypothetical protein HYC85_015191 [Camellia sinensis]|uniref:Uncharacterized protein n=1 Tax=Camellia sinensis TaxID=4442 RepID=A0A7J7HBI2_CAMSI|nr:hypothetical protein HYC85_015191 [Camellia sinensis]